MRKPALLAIAVLAAAAALAAERVEPKWESIDRRPTPPWFEDAKLGIFIHWGVYAVPSFAPRGEVSTYARYSEGTGSGSRRRTWRATGSSRSRPSCAHSWRAASS
jgi:hypothetical protein